MASDAPLKVLCVHNYYQQPGGEDLVFEGEAALLRDQGHEVETFTVDNDEIAARSKLGVALDTLWARGRARALGARLAGFRPDVVHFHNTFPLVSPAAYPTARRSGAAVVQTLHNYRLLCANAFQFREGRICLDCLGKTPPWPAIRHRCYRGSLAGSATVAAMQSLHRALGTWRDQVDLYIAISDFLRARMVAGGLPAERLVVKGNFLEPDPGAGPGDGGYALFIGRLSPEKGVLGLMEAWRAVGDRLPLKIVGDGPLRGAVEAAAADQPGIAVLGHCPSAQVAELLGRASFLICPSEWDEAFGRVVIEAYAHGTPVLAAASGALTELVEDGVTGLLFPPGDPRASAECVEQVLARPESAASWRGPARAAYEASFTGAANYRQLLAAYERAVARRRAQP